MPPPASMLDQRNLCRLRPLRLQARRADGAGVDMRVEAVEGEGLKRDARRSAAVTSCRSQRFSLFTADLAPCLPGLASVALGGNDVLPSLCSSLRSVRFSSSGVHHTRLPCPASGNVETAESAEPGRPLPESAGEASPRPTCAERLPDRRCIAVGVVVE